MLSRRQAAYAGSIFQKILAEQGTDYLFKNDLIRTYIQLLIHEALLKHRADPLFSEVVQAFGPFMKKLKANFTLFQMSLTSYITLGRSGLRVSPLCLGAMTFGEDWGIGSSPQESAAILARYRELGGNFLDMSNAYNNGHSEKIVGDAMGRESSKRDRMVIGTKFANNLYPGDPNGGGNGTKALIQQCEQSLRRLQTDYIDLY